MKNLLKIFTITLLLATLSVVTFAQSVNDNATATATIVAPLTITRTVHMNFGIMGQGANPGDVDLSPASVRTHGAIPGDVQFIPGHLGTITAASFDITGTAGFLYDITLPPTATTLQQQLPAVGGVDMTVDTWVSNPSGQGTLDGTGNDVLTVGATLHVGASQAAGVYISGTPFVVTIIYN
jgi:hypothetical protein